MATSTSTRDRLIAATGLPLAWVEGVLRILRQEGFLQTGGRGGGKSAVHYDSRQFALIMLALAAPRLAEVVPAVKLLKDLPFQEEIPAGISHEPFPILQEQVANWIENAAVARRLGKPWTDDGLRRLLAWQINVCLEVGVAFITYEPAQGERIDTVYAKGPVLYPSLRRHTILTGEVLLAFGELWADTQLERERLAIRASSAKAGSENKNADTSPKVPASSTNQFPAKGSGAVASSEANGETASGEVSVSGGTGHDSMHEPDLFNHAGGFRCLTMT